MGRRSSTLREAKRAARFTTENDRRRRYCLCTPRDRNLDAEDSFSMQAATLITVGSLSNRETVGSGFEQEEEEEGRGRKRKVSCLPPPLCLATFPVTVNGRS